MQNYEEDDTAAEKTTDTPAKTTYLPLEIIEKVSNIPILLGSKYLDQPDLAEIVHTSQSLFDILSYACLQPSSTST